MTVRDRVSRAADNLFSLDDIARLETASTCKLTKGANPGVLVDALCGAFDSCIFLVTNHETTTRDEDIKKYNRILKLTSRLLTALGYDPVENPLVNPALAKGARISVRDSPLPYDHGVLLMNATTSDRLDGALLGQTRKFLVDANLSIESVRLAAYISLDISNRRESGPGAKPSKAADLLFALLTSVFYASFGSEPNVDGDRVDKNDPDKTWMKDSALLWIKEVLRLVRDRSCGQHADVQAVINTAAKIKDDASIANRLREGWLDWKGWGIVVGDDQPNPYMQWPSIMWNRGDKVITGPPKPEWIKSR